MSSMRRNLLLMHHLDWLQARRDARRIETRQHSCEEHHRKCCEQQRDRPMKLDGPAKRLLVDDKDEQQREHEAERESRHIGQQTYQPGLQEDNLSDLPYAGTQEAQQSQLSPAVD